MKNIKKVLALTLVAISLLAIAVPALAVTTGTYNTAAVNLRSTMGGTSLGLVSKGATCNILDARTDTSGRAWYQVKITSHTSNTPDLYNYTGWSWQQYITVSGGTTPSTHPQTETEAFGSGYLEEGATGNWVRNVQLVLEDEGYIGDRDIDGIFGPHTFGAVCDYQEDFCLDIDGVVGPQTRNICGITTSLCSRPAVTSNSVILEAYLIEMPPFILS